MTALMYSCDINNVSACKILHYIETGLTTCYGYSSLHFAALNQQSDTIKYVIEAEKGHVDEDMMSALIYAVDYSPI